MKRIFFAWFVVIIVVSSLHAQFQYPQAKKGDQVDNYSGVQVHDPYRWMENDTAKEVAEWVQAENKVTFDYLEKIPYRNQIKERMTKLWNYPKYGAPFREGKYWFFFKNDGLQNQSVMYYQTKLDGTPEVFLDPNKLSDDGTVSLGGFSFSNDGKYFAYSISKSGSDWRDIYVMEVETKKKLSDELHWGKFTGISWFRYGFYYCRYDAPSDPTKALSNTNEFHKVYYHLLGSPQSSDILVFEDKQNPQLLFSCVITDDERFLFITAASAASRGNKLWVRDLKRGGERFIPLVQTFDDDFYPVDNFGERLVIRTNKNAPNGKLIVINADKPDSSNWIDLVSETGDAISSVGTGGGKIFITYTRDVTPHVMVYNPGGITEGEVQLPMLGALGGFNGKREDIELYFTMTSFTTPSTIYKYEIPSHKVTLFRKPEFDFNADDYETKQVFYNSKDGTRIPMFITHKKGLVMDGNNPTLLYGYGGFNISINPTFDPARLVWLEQGGVYASANLRGGSEYGEKWHEGGKKLNKQNVFDDFISAAEYLIAQKYTSSKKLAIYGRSNGGLLIGAVTNQRPELFRVSLPAVGVMDMLRFHKFTIGWAWVDDYGSSDDATQFNNLYKFSPLHNIKEGKEYPAILVTTADHDDRVVPAHSFKYMATLQEKYTGKNPVMIRIETKAGHGGGKPTSKIIEENSDMYAFTWYNMGLTPVW